MIRPCMLEDEQIWLKLNKEFMEYEYLDDNVWENPMEKGNIRETFRSIVTNPQSETKLFLIEDGDEVIGFMNTVVFRSIWAGGYALLLDDFFITKAYRDRGYGAAAIKELEELCRSKGYVRVQLLAEDTNPGAVRFYGKNGYSRQKINFFCKYL